MMKSWTWRCVSMKAGRGGLHSVSLFQADLRWRGATLRLRKSWWGRWGSVLQRANVACGSASRAIGNTSTRPSVLIAPGALISKRSSFLFGRQTPGGRHFINIAGNLTSRKKTTWKRALLRDWPSRWPDSGARPAQISDVKFIAGLWEVQPSSPSQVNSQVLFFEQGLA